MLGSAPIIAFISATDLIRAREFYADTLGLAVAEVSDFACVLRGAGTMLRVTLVDELQPQPFTVLGWQVGDIDVAMAELTGRGVRFERYESVPQDRNGVWTTPDGARIAWFTDPFGNVLSLTQF